MNIPQPVKQVVAEYGRVTYEMMSCHSARIPFVTIPIGLELLCCSLREHSIRQFDHIKNNDNVVAIQTKNSNSAVCAERKRELEQCAAEIAAIEGRSEATDDDKKQLDFLRLKHMRLESECQQLERQSDKTRKFIGYSNQELVDAYMLNSIMSYDADD